MEEDKKKSFREKLSDICAGYGLPIIVILAVFILVIAFASSVDNNREYTYAQIYAPNGELIAEGEVDSIVHDFQNSDFVTITINGASYHVDEQYVIGVKTNPRGLDD